MPARASFVSGLYPHNHGLWVNRGALPADDETFFHHLQRIGYHVMYVGKSHFYSHGGFHLREREPYMHCRGIDTVHETTGPWATTTTRSYMTDHWETRGLYEVFKQDYEKRREAGAVHCTWPSPLPEEEHLDSYVGRVACELAEASTTRTSPCACSWGSAGRTNRGTRRAATRRCTIRPTARPPSRPRNSPPRCRRTRVSGCWRGA
jgi:hypothetical protein